MAYQMVATAVTLNDLEGHSQVVGIFKCNPSNMYAAFYTTSTDSMLHEALTRQPATGAAVFKVIQQNVETAYFWPLFFRISTINIEI